MKSESLWVDKVVDRDKNDQCIWDLCFSPDGMQIVAAAGSRVLVYNAEDGALIQALKGHKDAVYCVTYAKDGKRFASGSADKMVIIWATKPKLEGILKYSHNDSIQCLAFNPLSGQLASCACSDFGLWSTEQKSVNKSKVAARVTCCSWTKDGQYLAIGLYNGVISIRSKTGEEKRKFERPGGALSPVWSLEWCPSKDDKLYTLAAADWGQKVAFYRLLEKSVTEKAVNYDPACISWFHTGDFVLISGSNHECNLYTKDGTKLGLVAKSDSWIWAARSQPGGNGVVIGCQDGTVAMYQLQFSTVHSLYKTRYAYRDNMTDVIVQHLLSEDKVRIKNRDMVKKIAVYRNRLAVQLTEVIIIYELQSDDPNDMHYRIKERINKAIECNLLVVATNHLMVCQERRLQCYNFRGIKEREWMLDSPIRYTKVLGGSPNKEGLLIGMKNGQIVSIFLDNPFPVQLLKQASSVRCLDINCTRDRLAVIDEHQTLLVYDLKTKDLLYQEPNATSVAWNSINSDMLCFSGNGTLNIKASNFPVHQQNMQGFVVGFTGSKIFCLNVYAMSCVDVPQNAPMYQYLEKKQLKEAYQVACLGVTDSDWQALATSALMEMRLDIAFLAYARLKDIKFLQLIYQIKERQRRGESDSRVFLGDIYAYMGKFAEAAKKYKEAGQEHRAMNMYTDLKMFDQAKDYMADSHPEEQKTLMAKQADWARDQNNPKSAAEMYMTAGEYDKAIEMMGKHGWTEMLIDVARKMDKADVRYVTKCAEYLRQFGQFAFAAECYYKIGETQKVLELHVEARHWEDAFQIAEKHPEYKPLVYRPYAKFLAENDRFEEAQAAFHQAGLEKEAVRVLQVLTENAVHERRFADAGYYYWKLSMQCLEIAGSDPVQQDDMLTRFAEFRNKADTYYAYQSVQHFMEEPFLRGQPENLLNTARYLVHKLSRKGTELPPGVSKMAVYYTMAKQALDLKAFKLARHAYEKLQAFKVPAHIQETVELNSLRVRSKPFHDVEDLLPYCFRCTTTNPMLNAAGNRCVRCKQPFIFSFVSFDALPLVEFFLERDITDDEAMELIEYDPAPKSKQQQQGPKERRGTETASSQYQSLRLDEGFDEMMMNGSGGDNGDDPFTRRLMNFDPDSDEFSRVYVDRETLKSIPSNEVVVLKWPTPMRCQYFKSMLPDYSTSVCHSCNKIFSTDDFEFTFVQRGCCPFCRKSKN
ncbi:hypothetical protein BOX15_Mlig006330g1 [Macrostomum lignano]|uniref:Intraflagellar transport protein 122 homolog n=1 Tax=Macrostomum lignano TaxID=282301 RepID=A0A267H5X6_9PLAT|nr:hypothetical protein BOX15_Mlig006330g1 [Macrostomum lignano]